MNKVKHTITASIVLYKNNRETLKETILSFLNTELDVKLYLVDNSPDSSLSDIANNPNVEYIFNEMNLGFGKAHNIAIKKVENMSHFHLILNPDVNFDKEVLPTLISVLTQDEDIGLIIPNVLYMDGSTQRSCKRLPTPFDLFLRRFLTNKISNKIFRTTIAKYEMHDKNIDECFLTPSVSGCFMLFRSESLRFIGGFDERYFMYLEDVDISRRMYLNYKNLYYPHVHIYHDFAKESYSNHKLLWIHIKSAIRYFNKWGWFFDSKRTSINKN